MFSIDNLKTIVERRLNDGLDELDEHEFAHNPFKLFVDVGEVERSVRNLNDVYSNRYGVISILSSNSTPINEVAIYNATVSVDLLVNVDRSILEGDNSGEYQEVKDTRAIIDMIADKFSGVPFLHSEEKNTYSVVTVFTLSSAGTFEVVSSKLGKIVPFSFTIDLSVVEQGVNSSNIHLFIDDVEVACSQFAEDMVSSAEGQTRLGKLKSTFNVQETKYAIAFVTPLLDNALCKEFLKIMHRGGYSIDVPVPVYKVTVGYDVSDPVEYNHSMIISSIRLTAQIPNNAGLNIEMIESDQPYEQS